MSLAQWRATDSLAERMFIASTSPARRYIHKCLAPFASGAGVHLSVGRILSQVADVWRREQRFAAVLCTHPALWNEAMAIDVDRRICDLHNPDNVQLGEAIYRRRFWRRRASQQQGEMERQVARQANVITVSRIEDMHPYRIEPCQTLLVPDALDLSYFAVANQPHQPHRQPADATPPRLVYHADWRHDGRRWSDWFHRHVWPRVQAALPEAELAYTSPDRPLGPLRDASVVFLPQTDPRLARWPILQAMAMRRAVVASGEAVQGMGVKHRHHAMLCRNQEDWADLCIESLRSARIRLELARAARSYVERHCPIERSGKQLLRTLQQPNQPNISLARAA